MKDSDRATDIAKLKRLSAEALDGMRESYAAIIKQAETFAGPKAKYTPKVVNSRIAEIREGLLGYSEVPEAFRPREAK